MSAEKNKEIQALQEILAISLKGGFGKPGEGGSPSTKLLNNTRKEISALIDSYEKNKDAQSKSNLLKKIDHFMRRAQAKILKNTLRNKIYVATHPNLMKDTETMLIQMQALASYGQELTQNKNFGNGEIETAYHSLKASENDLVYLSHEVQAIKKQVESFQASLSTPEETELNKALEILKHLKHDAEFNFSDGFKDKLLTSYIKLEKFLDALAPAQKKALPLELKNHINLIVLYSKGCGDKWEEIVSGKKLFNAFAEGNTPEFSHVIKSMSPAPAEERGVQQGPIQKNKSTEILEKIIKSFLNKDLTPAKFEIRDGNQMVAIYEDKIYDMNKILQNADFKQLAIDSEELAAYEKFLREGNPELYPEIAVAGHEALLKKAGVPENAGVKGKKGLPVIKDIDHLLRIFEEKDEKKNLKNLSPAEKLALNIYTTESYADLNALMRGQIDKLHQKAISPNALKELLLAAAIGVRGLNNISESVPVSTFRVDKKLPNHLIDKRLKAAKDKSIIVEMGFVSTSMNKPDHNFVLALKNPQATDNEHPAGTVFTGVWGKDVSPLTFFSSEKEEFLIPPTQMQLQEAVQVGECYYFLASPVISPEGLHQEEDLYLFDENKDAITHSIQENVVLSEELGELEEVTISDSDFSKPVITEKVPEKVPEKVEKKSGLTITENFQNHTPEQKIIENLQSMFKPEENFSIIPTEKNSFIVSKEDKPLISVSPKEVVAQSVENVPEDYKRIVELVTKIYQKPYLTFVSESEKPKLEAVIESLALDKDDFLITSDLKHYETMIKTKEAEPAPAVSQRLRS